MFIPQLDLKTGLEHLAKDVGLNLSTRKYILKRFTAEGLSFLTCTMPKLDKVLLQSLKTGRFMQEEITEFGHWKGLLKEFRGYLLKIFDLNGSLKVDYCPISIWALRQLCAYCHKLAVDYTEKTLANAVEKYHEAEATVSSFQPDNTWSNDLRKNLETYYPKFAKATVDDIFISARPRTTKGAFAGSSKVYDYTAYKRLRDSDIGTCLSKHRAFSGFFKPYPSAPVKISLVNDDLSSVSEVCFVPKTASKPRVISKEPYHQLRGQMAFFSFATKALTDDTSGRIQFRRQDQNNELARLGSIDGKYTTMDLSSASDLVSYRLIRKLFRNCAGPRYFISHFRSGSASIQGGRAFNLFKLSGMGSGLTFPTMALLIHLSICSEVARVTRLPYSRVMRRVYVYGDDIALPTTWYHHARNGLIKSGLQVNDDKSFNSGPFRESCGGDYVGGNDVTPVRLRLSAAGIKCTTRAIEIRNDLTAIQVYAHYRELSENGMNHLAQFFMDAFERYAMWKGYISKPLPLVSRHAPYLGRVSYVPLNGTDTPVDVLSTRSVVAQKRTGKIFCPYKHLSSFLKQEEEDSSTSQTSDAWTKYLGLDDSPALPYGFYPKIREARIVRASVPEYVSRSYC